VTQLTLVVDLSLPLSTPPARLEQLYRECHLPWLEMLLRPSAPPVAICINSWLLQQWVSRGWEDGLSRLRSLYDFGKVELLGTASHLAILPLVPESVAFRQVRRQMRLMQQMLHPEWRPAGFCPPALAFGHELSRVLNPLGFQWCLADDTALAALHGDVPGHHLVRCQNLLVLLVSRLWSGRLKASSPEQAAALAGWHHQELLAWLKEGGYQVLCLSGLQVRPETVKNFVEAHLKLGNRFCHPSHLLPQFPAQDGDVPPGSAFTPVEDFWNGQFFSPWNAQGEVWELSQAAIAALEVAQDQLDELIAQGLFSSDHSAEGLRLFVERWS
jgi:hypothetical protein